MIVLDASVIAKWLLNNPRAEPDTERASELMRRVLAEDEEILQPPHWLAEIGAVLSRLSPISAARDIEMLHALDLPIRDDATTYKRACQMAIDLEQHVFDTLYHAIALETDGAMLITADERYARAALPLGRIVRLSAWGTD